MSDTITAPVNMLGKRNPDFQPTATVVPIRAGMPLMVLPVNAAPKVIEAPGPAPVPVTAPVKVKPPVTAFSESVYDWNDDNHWLMISHDHIAQFKMSEMTMNTSCVSTVKFDKAGLLLLAYAIIAKKTETITGTNGGWIEYRNDGLFDVFRLREPNSKYYKKVIRAKHDGVDDMAWSIRELFDD